MDSYAGRQDMFPIEICRLTGDQHSDTHPRPVSTPSFSAATTASVCSSSERHAKQHLRRNGCKDEIDEPRGIPAEKKERESKKADRHNPEYNTGRPLEFGGWRAWSSPPADEPAEQRNRVIGRMRISDQPVNCKREKEHCAAQGLGLSVPYEECTDNESDECGDVEESRFWYRARWCTG